MKTKTEQLLEVQSRIDQTLSLLKEQDPKRVSEQLGTQGLKLIAATIDVYVQTMMRIVMEDES